MAHTNSWNEASPAGTDLASTADDHMRQIKLDVRERMALDHVWNSSLDHDGKHKKLTFHSDGLASAVVAMSATRTLTGSDSFSFFDLAETWNTTGAPTFFKVNITDTASASTALLMDLRVGGVSKFSVKKDGTITFTGAIATSSLLTITGIGGHTIIAAGSGGNHLTIRNTTAGAASYAGIILGNDLTATGAFLWLTSGSYTPTSVYLADGLHLETGRAGGIGLLALHASGVIRFAAGGSERMRLQTTGYLSVGTALASTRITAVGTGEGTAVADGGDKGATILVSSTEGVAGDGGGIQFGYGYGTYAQGSFCGIRGHGTDSAGNTLGDLAFWLRAATGDSSFTERMRILANGRVGIGTAAPGYTLEVSGTVKGGAAVFNTVTCPSVGIGAPPFVSIGRTADDWTASGYVHIVNKDGVNYYLWVDATGDLRIGTAAPTELGGGNDLSGTIVGTQS